MGQCTAFVAYEYCHQVVVGGEGYEFFLQAQYRNHFVFIERWIGRQPLRLFLIAIHIDHPLWGICRLEGRSVACV